MDTAPNQNVIPFPLAMVVKVSQDDLHREVRLSWAAKDAKASGDSALAAKLVKERQGLRREIRASLERGSEVEWGILDASIQDYGRGSKFAKLVIR